MNYQLIIYIILFNLAKEMWQKNQIKPNKKYKDTILCLIKTARNDNESSGDETTVRTNVIQLK